MPATKLDYVPGAYEALTSETLDDTPVNNTWYHFNLDGWPLAMSDIVLVSDGDTLVLGTDYELAADAGYTSEEVSQSGKTVYAMWRIINASYEGLAVIMSGNNFGSYVSNEAMKDYVDAQVGGHDAADEISYDNTTSGLTATDVQAAIDEIQGDASKIDYDNTISGLAADNVKAAIDEVQANVDTGSAPETIFEGILGSSMFNNSNTEYAILFAGTGFSSGVFTAPEDGTYDLNAVILSTANGAPVYYRVYVNSTEKLRVCVVTNSNQITKNIVWKFTGVSSGNTIRITAYSPASSYTVVSTYTKVQIQKQVGST